MIKKSHALKRTLQEYSRSELIEFIVRAVASGHSDDDITDILGNIRLVQISHKTIENIRKANRIDSEISMLRKVHGHKNCQQIKSLLAERRKNNAEFNRLNKEHDRLFAEIYGADDCKSTEGGDFYGGC